MTASAFRRRGRSRGCSRTPACRTTACCNSASARRRIVVVTPAAYCTDNDVTLDAIAQLGAAGARRRGGASDRHRRRAQAHGGRRHPRHPLHAIRSDNRDHDDRHDRAAGAARAGARLACADSSARRPDRRRRRFAAAAARHDRVRPSRAADAAGGIEPSGLRDHPPDARRRPHLDEALRRLLRSAAAPTMRTRPRWRGPISPPRRSGWCGAATGRIRPRRTSPTTRCCSICCADWAPDDATRHRILVENPAKLYGFREAVFRTTGTSLAKAPQRRHRRAGRARLRACRSDGSPPRRRGPSCRNRRPAAPRRHGRRTSAGR